MNTNEYLEKITNTFPKELKTDILEVFKIIPQESNHKFNLISSNSYKVIINNEKFEIPVRIYFDEPKEQNEMLLSEKQKDILNCLYTRHCNGFIREKRLKQISQKPENWKTPFIVQLLGEYIYELFPIINKRISKDSLIFYHNFKTENTKYWQQTESRLASYWNAYYRNDYPDFKTYLGRKIMNRIKK